MASRKLTRARDSRGRPVVGIYKRDNRFVAGYWQPNSTTVGGRWLLKTLRAETLTDARRERESLRAGLREGRIANADAATFEDLFNEWQDSREISQRTAAHERELAQRHLRALLGRRVQDVTPTEIARLLRGMRGRYAPWTCVAVYRILKGTFALALLRRVITRSPVDGIAPSERPKQRNARRVTVLSSEQLGALVAAGSSERWRCALALAAFAGLRLGELRGLTWADLDLEAGTLSVSRSLARDGTPQATKTEAGEREVPLLPTLRRLLLEWRLRSPHSQPGDLVIGTADGLPLSERNLRRALEAAKTAVGLASSDQERLSWHSLRHSWASALATDLGLPATTLAALAGHADAGFTLRVYAKDGRDTAAVVADVLARAEAAGVGG